MKKRFSLLIAAIAIMLTAASCSDDPVQDPEYKFSLNKKDLTFEAAGSAAQTINVTAENVDWGITGADSWIHPVKNGSTISVTVDDYDNTEQKRDGKFTVASGNTAVPDIVVTVTQNLKTIPPPEYVLEVDPATVEFLSRDNDTQIITVTADVDWDVAYDGPTWLTVEKKEDSTIEVSAANNHGDVRERQTKFLVTSSVDYVEDIEITVTQAGDEPTVFLKAQGAQHRGDHYGNGVDNFKLSFTSVEFDPETYMALNDGFEIVLDLFSETPADPFNPDIAAGDYTVSLSQEKFTASPDWGCSFIRNIEGGYEASTRSLVSGGFTVERSGNDYIFSFDMMVVDDFFQTEHHFKGEYRGEIAIDNQYKSSLRSDFALPTLVGGHSIFKGEYYWGQEINVWEVFVWSAGVQEWEGGTVYGTGHYLKLELYSPLSGSTTLLPVGIYPINQSQETGTALAGGEFTSGSWYLETVNDMIYADGSQYGPLASGEITVSYANDEYTIVIDAKDDIGNKITGSYTGALRYIDSAY